MRRHPFHVQECGSIWHVVEGGGGEPPDPFSYDVEQDNPPSFVAPLKHGVQPDGLQAVLFENTHTVREDDVPLRVVDTSPNPSQLTVVARKQNGQYSVWINGAHSQSEDGVHHLPAYNTYYRNIDADGQRTAGALNPVNFTLLVESGESTPDQALLRTYQVRRSNGSTMKREQIGEVELGVTRADALDGLCTTMPYPCVYTQKPYITIRDIDAQTAAVNSKNRRFVFGIIAIAISWTLRLFLKGVFPAMIDLEASSILRESSALGPRGFIKTMFSYGAPVLAVLGITATSFLDMTTTSGLVTIVWAITGFMKNVLEKIPGDKALGGGIAGLFSLLGSQGMRKLYRMNFVDWIPFIVVWLFDKFKSATPRPEVKFVKYTALDISDSLRAMCASDTTSISGLDYKERVLLRWMLEPPAQRRGSMKEKFKEFANSANATFVGGRDPYPISGNATTDGTERSVLMRDTVEIQYEMVFVDSDVCQSTPILISVRGDNHSAPTGGFFAAGIIEDNESVLDSINLVRRTAKSTATAWRVVHLFFGVPFLSISKENAAELGRNLADDSIFASMREHLLEGAQKVENELFASGFERLRIECTARKTYPIAGKSSFVCRLLAQRLKRGGTIVPMPVMSNIEELQYDTSSLSSVPMESDVSTNTTLERGVEQLVAQGTSPRMRGGHR
jgi:hypothetical protein